METNNVFHCYKSLILLLLQSGPPHIFMNNILFSAHDPLHPFLKPSESLLFVKSLIITSTWGCNTVPIASIFARQWSTPPSWKQSQWCAFYDSKWNINEPTHQQFVVHFSPRYWRVSECYSRAPNDDINTLVTSSPKFIKSSNELWIDHDSWCQITYDQLLWDSRQQHRINKLHPVKTRQAPVWLIFNMIILYVLTFRCVKSLGASPKPWHMFCNGVWHTCTGLLTKQGW
jgi:hypothetical protein